MRELEVTRQRTLLDNPVPLNASRLKEMDKNDRISLRKNEGTGKTTILFRGDSNEIKARNPFLQVKKEISSVTAIITGHLAHKLISIKLDVQN